MNPQYYGLIEIFMTFGGMLAFAWWQLSSLKKLERERLEKMRDDNKEPAKQNTEDLQPEESRR